uniref:Retinoic acid receptor responder protein 2 n=1 Tax=Lepisosteus oculatus TaxID=7918 RepID=W5MVT3_LEPOC
MFCSLWRPEGPQYSVLSPQSCCCNSAERNMSRLLSVLLITVGALLASAEEYDKLPDLYKEGVNLAVKQFNSQKKNKQLFLFFKSMDVSETELEFDVSYVYHNFLLKATKCLQDKTDASANSCPFQNDRPVVDCVMCYRSYQGSIEYEPRPKLYCTRKPQLTEEMKANRVQDCETLKHHYSPGGITLLSSTGCNGSC